MKTLEQLKKDKNYLACENGYPIDPEGFSYEFLFKRFKGELHELYDKIYVLEDKPFGGALYSTLEFIPESQFLCNNGVMDELADLSNIIDYIATKMITGYSTKYDSKKVEGGENKLN